MDLLGYDEHDFDHEEYKYMELCNARDFAKHFKDMDEFRQLVELCDLSECCDMRKEFEKYELYEHCSIIQARIDRYLEGFNFEL